MTPRCSPTPPRLTTASRRRSSTGGGGAGLRGTELSAETTPCLLPEKTEVRVWGRAGEREGREGGSERDHPPFAAREN